MGVYLGLSVVDFPFCFLAVRLVGPDRIGEVEHATVDGFWNLVSTIVPSMKAEHRGTVEAVEAHVGDIPDQDENGPKVKEEASTYLHNRRTDRIKD